ncbi:MAG TPA: ATP-binding protein [Ramlibacter sp.]|uniref:ATP-binding protein n=1 Tax=Ramlibacter sp. TaxID=1917967 RepID=UPI002ED4A652
MTNPPASAALPTDETERRRLARLRMLAVLDTEPEPVFDALVRIAAAICGTPIALMSLVDEERQWFKANRGLEGVTETRRDLAFCDHAIRDDAVMEVPDATRDARFRANPLVTGEPGIRFYAGAPISMPSGERIGTLCVIDRQPGSLTPQQQAALRDLAAVAQWALLQRERLHDLTVVGDESRFQAISFASPLGIFQADANGALFHLNGRGQEILGFSQERALGLGWQDAVVPAERGQVAFSWDETVAGRADFDREFDIARPDGSRGAVHVQARPGRWGEPPRSGFIGVIADISERRAAEEQAARTAAIVRGTVEATTDALLVVGPDGDILLTNQRFMDLWRIPPELVKRSNQHLIRHVLSQVKDPAAFTGRIRELLASSSRESFDMLDFHDGRVFERYSRPLLLGDARPGRVWSFRDVTQRRAAEAEVRQAQAAAEAASVAKSAFLDNVSHEIRTPLNGVLGLTRLLLAEELTPQQRRYVELADASAGSLLELINDLLDLGKIESGRMELENTPFRLDELLQQLAELYRLRAGEKGLRFMLDVDARVPRAVTGDAGRLRQVLNNLLTNALKFTTQGEFGLVVGRAAPGRGEHTLMFSVWDTGIGIPHEVQQRLFQRFTQADSSTARRFGGTGLGLAIVKQLCEMMGGSVLLQSEPGRGASFRCEIPLRPAAAAQVAGGAPKPAPATARHDTRVLVAEDNETNQVVIRGLLAQAGYHEVTVVGDGQEAVEAAEAEDYDLVLMDCRMPRVDGYEASRRLRAQGFTQPIVALTANAAAGERERCLAWGMNDYLPKPVDPARLAQVLAEWTGNAASTTASPASAAAAPTQDTLFDRELALQRLGGDPELFTVALESFRQHAPRVLASATEALSQARQADLHRHLHSLAGSAAMIGADPVQAVARELETSASEGDLVAVERELPRLCGLFARFLEESADW